MFRIYPGDSDLLVWDETPAIGLQKAPTWFQWTAKVENSCLQGMQVVECEGLDLFFFFFFFLAKPCSLQDLSSLTRAWNQAMAVKAWNTNHQATRELPK